MNPLRLPKERVDSLDPAALESRLRAHGFQERSEASTARMGVFRHPSGPDEDVLVPRDKGFVDYALRVGEVLTALAVVEKRTAWQVLDELSGCGAEVSKNGPVASARKQT
ncbi:MAG: hypothetical protein L0Z62_21885 [Gemmataceae bacterium]|nr:hypothetical protein [Gemmataceae bacterium]